MYIEKFLSQVHRKLKEQGISNSKLREDCIEVFEGENVIFKIDAKGGMFYSSDKQFRNIVDKLHDKIQPIVCEVDEYLRAMDNGTELMVEIKSYANKFDKLFAQKPPFPDMEVNEEATHWAIKKHSLDVAKSLRENADKLFQMADSQYQNERNQIIRKYFVECLSDGNPHKMNEIKDYIFSKMQENNEYSGERSSAYIYPAISSLIVEGGPYQKITRGVYQISREVQQSNSVYTMDDVVKLLDRGCSLAEKNIRGIVSVEIHNAEDIVEQITADIESSIDTVSYLIAFAEDYMDRREEPENEQGISMSGM